MNISDIIKDYKIEKNRKTERGEIMSEFIYNINLERDKKYKAMTFPRMAYLLQGIPTNDLYAFLSMCKDRQRVNGSFSKFFWWAIKSE